MFACNILALLTYAFASAAVWGAITVTRIGFYVDDNRSGATATLTLWFNSRIYQCDIIPNQINSENACDSSTITMIGTDCSSSDAKILIDNPYADAFHVANIFFETSDGTYYKSSDFCVSDAASLASYYRTNPLYQTSTTCSAKSESGHIFQTLCIDSDDCTPSKQLVYFDTSRPNEVIHDALWEDGTAVSIAPNDEICVIRMGFYVHSNPSADTVTLTLWFNSRIYGCDITPNKVNSENACDSSTIAVMGLECSSSDTKILIDNHGYDGFFIQNIFFETADGTYYEASAFCVNDAASLGAPYRSTLQTSDSCTSMGGETGHLFEMLCVDIDDCTPSTQLVYFDTTRPNEAIRDAIWQDGTAVSTDPSCPVTRIGFYVDSNPSADTATLTLWFSSFIYQCNLIPNQLNSENACDVSTITVIGSDCSSSTRVLIDNPHRNAFHVQNIFFETSDGTYYKASAFCINNEASLGTYYRSHTAYQTGDGCSDTDGEAGHLFETLCIDTDDCTPSKQLVYFDTTRPNQAIRDAFWEDGTGVSAGLGCAVTRIGVYVDDNPSAATATLTLWFDSMIYQCDITPNQINSENACDSSTITVIGRHTDIDCSSETKILIDNQDRDAFHVANIFFETFGGTYYKSSDFCVSDAASLGSYYRTNPLYQTSTTCSAKSEPGHIFQTLCIDSDDCTPSKQLVYFDTSRPNEAVGDALWEAADSEDICLTPGVFALQNKLSSQCIYYDIDHDSTPAFWYTTCVLSETNDETQSWTIDGLNANNEFRLRKAGTNRCIVNRKTAHIDSPDGWSFGTAICTDIAAVFWEKYQVNSDGSFMIRNRYTSRCLFQHNNGRFGVAACNSGYSDQWWRTKTEITAIPTPSPTAKPTHAPIITTLGTIRFGETKTGSIEANEEHKYSLTLSGQDTENTLAFIPCGSNFDTILYLYDMNGNIIKTANDDDDNPIATDCGSELGDLLFPRNELENGDYIIGIGGSGDSHGTYRITMVQGILSCEDGHGMSAGYFKIDPATRHYWWFNTRGWHSSMQLNVWVRTESIDEIYVCHDIQMQHCEEDDWDEFSSMHMHSRRTCDGVGAGALPNMFGHGSCWRDSSTLDAVYNGIRYATIYSPSLNTPYKRYAIELNCNPALDVVPTLEPTPPTPAPSRVPTTPTQSPTAPTAAPTVPICEQFLLMNIRSLLYPYINDDTQLGVCFHSSNSALKWAMKIVNANNEFELAKWANSKRWCMKDTNNEGDKVGLDLCETEQVKDRQYWSKYKVNLDSETFMLRNKATSRCLKLRRGIGLRLSPCQTSDIAQWWKHDFRPYPNQCFIPSFDCNGPFPLINRDSMQCIHNTNGAFGVATCNGNAADPWRLLSDSVYSGAYQIQNVATDKCIQDRASGVGVAVCETYFAGTSTVCSSRSDDPDLERNYGSCYGFKEEVKSKLWQTYQTNSEDDWIMIQNRKTFQCLFHNREDGTFGTSACNAESSDQRWQQQAPFQPHGWSCGKDAIPPCPPLMWSGGEDRCGPLVSARCNAPAIGAPERCNTNTGRCVVEFEPIYPDYDVYDWNPSNLWCLREQWTAHVGSVLEDKHLGDSGDDRSVNHRYIVYGVTGLLVVNMICITIYCCNKRKDSFRGIAYKPVQMESETETETET